MRCISIHFAECMPRTECGTSTTHYLDGSSDMLQDTCCRQHEYCHYFAIIYSCLFFQGRSRSLTHLDSLNSCDLTSDVIMTTDTADRLIVPSTEPPRVRRQKLARSQVINYTSLFFFFSYYWSVRLSWLLIIFEWKDFEFVLLHVNSPTSVMGKLFKEGAKGKEKNFRRANIIY